MAVFLAETLSNAKDRIPIPIPYSPENYLAPELQEIRIYFITGLIGFFVFVGKEVWSTYKKSKDTTARDIHEILKNQNHVSHQIESIKEQLKHKPDRDEVLKDVMDTVRREIEHVSRFQK